jgi:membrane-associated phospholipid phosphatase
MERIMLSDYRPLSSDHALGVSDFADQAVVLPLAVGTGLRLAISGWRRGALAWAVAIGGTLALILLLKLRFFACDRIAESAMGGNPSGHTAAAAAVYGGLAGIITKTMRNDWRFALCCAVGLGASIAVLVGQSRLTLDKHSVVEVVVGGAIGVGGAAGFAGLAGRAPPAIPIWQIVAAGLIVVGLLHGARLSAEDTIRSVAAQLWPTWQCI